MKRDLVNEYLECIRQQKSLEIDYPNSLAYLNVLGWMDWEREKMEIYRNMDSLEYLQNVLVTEQVDLVYGKELDATNLVEELGDLMWYVALMLDELDTSFEEVWTKNIAKLRARYQGKFSEIKAENRNLNDERKALESSIG